MATNVRTLTLAFVAKMVAKKETADEVGRFLADAVSLANQEAGTVVWFALRTDATTFWIVDAFASEADRQTHIKGPIAAALMANADRLLASPPEILPADILASKVPDRR
jgi:quinol monooxygenase YgiN